MDTDKIVEHEMDCHRVSVVFDLFREGVGQPREPAHVHLNRQILALDIGCAGVLGIGLALPTLFPRTDTDGRAVVPPAFGRLTNILSWWYPPWCLGSNMA